MSGWWYLSFVDDDTDTFSGGAFVEASSGLDAVTRAHRLGINPGGQVLMAEVPAEYLGTVSADKREVLLDKAELQAIDPRIKSIREHEEEAAS